MIIASFVINFALFVVSTYFHPNTIHSSFRHNLHPNTIHYVISTNFHRDPLNFGFGPNF